MVAIRTSQSYRISCVFSQLVSATARYQRSTALVRSNTRKLSITFNKNILIIKKFSKDKLLHIFCDSNMFLTPHFQFGIENYVTSNLSWHRFNEPVSEV